MSGHTPSISPDPGNPRPNQNFFSWLRGQTTLFISQILGLLGFVSFTFSLIYYIHHQDYKGLGPEVIQRFVFFAHIILIGIFIVVLISLIDNNSNGSYRVTLVFSRIFHRMPGEGDPAHMLITSKIQLRKFKSHFLFFWISMFLLYLLFSIRSGFQDVDKAAIHHAKEVAGHTAAIATTWDAFMHLIFEFMTFALNNLGLLFVYWCFTVLQMPAHDRRGKRKQKLAKNYSGFIMLAITASFPLLLPLIRSHGHFSPESMTAYVVTFDAVSGTLNAVVLALLIARLDSKLIGLPSWLISILYFYAAVQPLFVAFEYPTAPFQIIKTVVVIVVFLFKIYFFLIIVYALQTGRMLNYLFCFPTLNKHVDSIFENQFEIQLHKEHKEFNIIIRKSDSVVFTSDIHFHNRQEGMDEISQYRDLMKSKKHYFVRHLSGTYWVEVKDKEQRVLLTSHNLRSDDEAKHLIIEALEKVPYCKVSFN